VVGEAQSLLLLVEGRDEGGPVLEGDLEDFALVDLRDLDEVEVRIEEDVPVLVVLEELEVDGEEVREEEGEVANQLLVGVGRVVVDALDVCT
jgi:hypothetical protein